MDLVKTLTNCGFNVIVIDENTEFPTEDEKTTDQSPPYNPMESSPMNVDEIILQLSKLKNVDVQIEKDTYYNANKWLVRFTWRSESDRVVVEETHELFHYGMEAAWNKLYRFVVKGQGNEALQPVALPKPDDYRD